MLRNLCSTALLSLCLAAIVPASFAQKYILPKIVVNGAPDYPQSGLLAVIALKTGGIATQEDVTAAAQRLSDTGLFADIRFESNSAGLIFTVKPAVAANLLPARFPNLVWWTPDELHAALKTRVPLFLGSVPVTGNLQDTIVAALKAMLTEKGVTASVVAIPTSPQPDEAPTAITFTVASPEVRLHSLTVASASSTLAPQLQKAAQPLLDKPFEEDTTLAAVQSRLLAVYRNNGYLDAALVTLTHSAPQSSAAAVNVDLTATVTEGQPYRITTVAWSGSDILSAADFSKSLKLHPEDIASQQSLDESLDAIRRAYFAKGYQDAKLTAPPILDAATHHVAYTIGVEPGRQYHLVAMHVVGLNAQQLKDFASTWKMQLGDVYDVTYLASFLQKITQGSSLSGYTASWKALSDPDTHSVDLTVTFARGATSVTAH